ncbi:glycosyltransferase family 2 protein [Burkholderia thailandensis]|uniref:Rhamnosyltransferase family protein n=1 Tax=Burkholderia thailandensis TaxID=57975 RepID=A0AAP6AHT2_BURTH|nr:glycosyltransferase family 2 protein [Burkholderia thailandensis]MCS3395483.1 glycosyltransferase family 2 protein [Burkholderia thailandensis]MCS6429149.1 glycosyltransferase family 2 protein [Burkholderia thailandensis]MCS6456855.1 glycosyltransferase family 2 protein [Burkholderia thailandensis]MCS6468151.1 glycosyltransferase family 2 protein [Burkholderia thailandensis]MCS6486558.1 glycosyltransferase family 2 protein [Burkholderia thailandensis]
MTILGALVILYDPTDEQLSGLEALARDSDALVVVDNTPHEHAAARERVRALSAWTNTVWRHHGNRGGVAGGYNAGLSALFAQGVEAVALFDQDSTVPAGYFERMREACAQLGEQPGAHAGAFIAGPRIYDANEQRFLPELMTSGVTVRRVRVEGETAPQRCAFLISSGSVISRAAYARLGRFDEALFIDHVDTEYCLRALAHNVPLYVVPPLVLTHRIGARRRHKVGPFELTAMHHGWLRRYYGARNAMQLGLQYGLRFPVALVPNLLTIWQVIQVVLCEREKGAKLRGIALGVLDGLFGRLGSFDDARAGAAAREPVRQE